MLRLVKHAQAVDEAAFARLVQPYMRKTYFAALKIARNREDAEDASQQAFMKALVISVSSGEHLSSRHGSHESP